MICAVTILHPVFLNRFIKYIIYIGSVFSRRGRGSECINIAVALYYKWQVSACFVMQMI
jgi:hypothetical protein